MKTFNLLLAFSLFSLYVSATQRTVNNNANLPGNPGQYTDIATALGASAPGDTILVAGSPTVYASIININQKIVLLGPGYNPDKQNPLTATIQGAINLTINNASGFVIMGFKITGGINFPSGTHINGALIRRNQLVSTISFADSNANVTIAENAITGGYFNMYTSKNQLNLLITNNIITSAEGYWFYPQYSFTTNSLPITITHNLFLAGNKTTPLVNSSASSWAYLSVSNYYNMVIENNIFYNISPFAGASQTFINFTFDNNITYTGYTLPTLPPSGCVGSGNKDNTDPLLTSLFNDPGNATINYTLDNLRLQNGSPASKAGTDGTDIGPTGGAYPVYLSTNRYLTGEPTIPEVKTAVFTPNSSVAPGGTLQIQTTATKIN